MNEAKFIGRHWKTVVAFAIALAFIMPGATSFVDDEEIVYEGVISNTKMTNTLVLQPYGDRSCSNNNIKEIPYTTDSVDWWPMFHHDLEHTGYSTSTAPDTNNVLWSYDTGNWCLWSSPAVSDGKVYFGSCDSNLYCIDETDGSFIWSYATGVGIWEAIWSSPAVSDEKVYFGSFTNDVYCLDATDGSFIWNYTTGDRVYSSPAVAYGNVYVCSNDYNLYCLDATDGHKIWNYTTGAEVYDSSPAVYDGKVYFCSSDYNVYCLDAYDGHKIWNYTTSRRSDSSPTVVDGKVYVGAGSTEFDGWVYCLDAYDGHEIWNYIIGADVSSSPAVAYGKVFVGSYDNSVYCLNETDGSFIWKYTTDDSIVQSSPAVADGKVYIGSADYNVYCLDAYDGHEIWSYATDDYVYSSPAVADGRVYIGSHDGSIYCFGSLSDHDVGVASIDSPVNGNAGVFIPEVTVKNYGLNNEIDVPVYMQITKIEIRDVVEYNETVYINIDSLETKTATFPDWTPEDLQNGSGSIDYIVTACTQLVGDEHPGNDCKTETITLEYIHDVGVEEITEPSGKDEILSGRSKTFYAYCAFDQNGNLPEGPVSFESDDPGNITSIAPTSSADFIAGATWADGVWYGCEYGVYGNDYIWTIDPNTGDMTRIGSYGLYPDTLNGLAYDPTTGIMYGAGDTNLYTVDMDTGAANLVGPFNTPELMISIACDNAGNLYGALLTSENDSFCSIDPATGAATIIGFFGVNINFAQDMEYDKNNDILYFAAFTVPLDPYEGALYTVDIDTGAATKIGTFQGSGEVTEITGFAIPYYSEWPPGPYPVEAIIKNYGRYNESNFIVNATIYKETDRTDEVFYHDEFMLNTTMHPDDEVIVTFDNVTFEDTDEGTYRLEIITELDVDENPDNDQKTLTFIIKEIPPDTTPPEIFDVTALPATQASGGWINITSTVTDDTEVDLVKVNILDPNSGVVNESMVNIAGTNGYYYNTTYTIIGTYNYFIWANDTSGNTNISAIYTFEIINNPPYTPSNPNPENGMTGVDINVNLSWTGGDPDTGDTVTYDVYFGTTSPPPQVTTGQSETTYDPGTMNYETTYYWQIVSWDNHGASTEGPIWDFTTKSEPNDPPDAPDIDGPTSGKAGVEYDYTFVAIDPNEDDIYYYIDWGDGHIEDWFGPYESDEEVVVSHTWDEQGTYTIKAKAKDTDDAESDWGELEVTMPRNRLLRNTLFMNLLERFPNAFPILRYILGL